MTALIALLESALIYIVELGILILEFIGVIILLWSAIKSIISLIRKDERVPLMLAKGIALSLEFKLGGEVLRTVIVREWEEILVLGAVIGLRGLLTFLIHWEIKLKDKELKDKEEKELQEKK